MTSVPQAADHLNLAGAALAKATEALDKISGSTDPQSLSALVAKAETLLMVADVQVRVAARIAEISSGYLWGRS